MSILITGGAGFIGSHLIQWLLRETADAILCVDNFNDYYDPALKRENISQFATQPRVHLAEVDFCDGEAMTQLVAEHAVTYVVHLGAYAGVRPSVLNPHIYQRNNVGGTLSLLEAVKDASLKRFVNVSSSTVYGNGARIPFCEDEPHGVPASPYGATKVAAETLGLTYWQLHDVPVVNVRPFSVYGPGVRPDLGLSIFADRIYRGIPLSLLGDGSARRDFTHVNDICRGLLAAMTADGVAGESINLGHGGPTLIRDIIHKLQHELGRPAIIEQKPPRPEDLPVTFADLTKAERLLDYRPQVMLDEGLHDYAQWFLSRQDAAIRTYRHAA